MSTTVVVIEKATEHGILGAPLWLEFVYLATAALFIIGLKRMSSPKTAASGIKWAGAGMVLACVATLFYPGLHNYGLMLLSIALASGAAWYSGKKVAMTDMPQMIALYNGMGGGAAAAIAAIGLYSSQTHGFIGTILAVAGALIGAVSLSGSAIAWAKLDGKMRSVVRIKNVQMINMALFAVTVVLGLLIVSGFDNGFIVTLFFVLALAFGVMMTLPIGGADMPVVISLYNAFTGLAVAFEGYVLGNAAMIIAGTVVGAAGTLLTQLMAKAMNRPITNVLFSNFAETGESSGEAGEQTGTMKPIDAADAAIQMAYAQKVIIVPGYGMAVAQAQHKVWEFCKQLDENGVTVKFAIHPVAGRMPGHMNVLLAEAGVPYDMIYDLDEINSEFESADVALIIGANDVVNPVARTNPDSPIYGMPILNADKAKNVIMVKRGQGAGYSGIQNELFFLDNTRMLYGDGQKVASELIAALKELGGGH